MHTSAENPGNSRLQFPKRKSLAFGIWIMAFITIFDRKATGLDGHQMR
jgi:hypothetical protein